MRKVLVEQYQQRIKVQLAALRSEGPVQPLPTEGERHSFSKAQVQQHQLSYRPSNAV